MSTIVAADATYAELAAAYAASSAGDTIEVPVDEQTWSAGQTLVMTHGVWLKGAGINQTIIHQPTATTASRTFTYSPATPADDDAFVVSGFTFDGNETCTGQGTIAILNRSLYPITKVRIFGNKFKDTDQGIYTEGEVWGVAYLNEFDSVRIALHPLGNNRTSWDNFNFSLGTAQNFYLEDNNLYVRAGYPGAGMVYANWTLCGEGGRYCARYNTWDFTNLGGATYLDLFDAHGNQGHPVYFNYAAMGVEIYKNTITNFINGRLLDHRGGQAVVWDNAVAMASGSFTTTVREEWDDTQYPTDDDDVQCVNNSYYWNNTKDGTRVNATTITMDGAYDGTPDPPVENTDFWNQQTSFDGSVGMGVGLLAARPSSGLTVGVGYWATDTKKLYRATGATTWEQFYVPYTYPHPLRGEPDSFDGASWGDWSYAQFPYEVVNPSRHVSMFF